MLPPVNLETLQRFLDLLSIFADPNKLKQTVSDLQDRVQKAEEAEKKARDVHNQSVQQRREASVASASLERDKQAHAKTVAKLEADIKFFNQARADFDAKEKRLDQHEARLNQRELMLNGRERSLEELEKQVRAAAHKVEEEKDDLAKRLAEAKKFLRVA
jgi:uncharacterized protein YhaN